MSNMGFNSALLYSLVSLAVTEEMKTKQNRKFPLLSHTYLTVTEVTYC